MIETQLTRAEQVIMEARGRAASADKNRKGKGHENKNDHINLLLKISIIFEKYCKQNCRKN